MSEPVKPTRDSSKSRPQAVGLLGPGSNNLMIIAEGHLAIVRRPIRVGPLVTWLQKRGEVVGKLAGDPVMPQLLLADRYHSYG